MLQMNEAKALAKSNQGAGEQFTTPTGAIGTILGEVSARKKPLAQLTCTEPGCGNTHVREISDWHQCGRCVEHAKKKGSGAGRPAGERTGTGLRSVKVGEDVFREMRTEGLEGEALEMAEENNRLVLALIAQVEEERAAQREAEKAAREAKAEEERKAREAAKAAKEAEERAARLEKIRALAAERGVAVSARTLAGE